MADDTQKAISIAYDHVNIGKHFYILRIATTQRHTKTAFMISKKTMFTVSSPVTPSSQPLLDQWVARRQLPVISPGKRGIILFATIMEGVSCPRSRPAPSPLSFQKRAADCSWARPGDGLVQIGLGSQEIEDVDIAVGIDVLAEVAGGNRPIDATFDLKQIEDIDLSITGDIPSQCAKT